MKAVELFPYWDDDRALLLEMLEPFQDEDLEFRPAPGLRTLGEVLRHVITTEEHWWRGGICGEPLAAWRPQGWERLTVADKEAHRARRFPSVLAIRAGLTEAHAPVAAFLGECDAWGLCEERRAAWGEDNTLRWILWHLVEHDQHHRAQVAARAHLLGYRPPALFPRISVMGRTPAEHWRPGDEMVRNIVPYWNQVQSALRGAVAALDPGDLAFRPAPDLPSIHDLVIHIFIEEDAVIRQGFGADGGRDWWRITAADSQIPVCEQARRLGGRFPTIEALLEGLDTVHAATRSWLDGLGIDALAARRTTAAGPQSLHHALWYAREHTVHHRAQVFLWLRILGRHPPDL
jgi:uncharacterized damage-inducible protein DinB